MSINQITGNEGNWPSRSNVVIEDNTLLFKIKKVALRIFEKIKEIVFFPARYFGSKHHCTGYHFKMQKELSPEEAKAFLPYAGANATVHSNDPDWLFGHQLADYEKLPDISGIEKRNTNYFNPETGLKLAVYENENELIISYGALTAYRSELPNATGLSRKGYLNCIANLAGGVPSIFNEAERITLELLKTYPHASKKVTLSGQCYGGTLASFVGIKNKIQAVCTNSFPLGAGLQKEIGRDRLDLADEYVTHISANKDSISDNRFLSVLDRIASAIGIRTPGNFGKRLVIPSAYRNSKHTHEHFMGSMMHHLGKKIRDKPREVF